MIKRKFVDEGTIGYIYILNTGLYKISFNLIDFLSFIYGVKRHT